MGDRDSEECESCANTQVLLLIGHDIDSPPLIT